MKCVGYDVDFQVSMTNDYTSWASPSRKKKPSGKNSKVIKKRKRSDDADSGEDRKSGEKLLNETENFTEEIYVPRPTRRSRRRKLSTTD